MNAVVRGPQRAARNVARTGVRVVRNPVWGEVTAPVTRAVGFYRQTRRRYEHPQPGLPIPPVPPSVALALQAAIDETVLTVMRLAHRPQPVEHMERVKEEVAVALELYGARGWLDDPVSFHRAPPPPDGLRIRPARARGFEYEVVSFPSEYEPYDSEPGRDRWLAHRANRIAYAWVLRHDPADGPRPWLVCIHGAAMGQPFSDLRIFRAAWLHQVLGLNVALPIQPLHGPRRDGIPFGVGFPGHDLLDNVHAVAQSAWDIRRLLEWIRAQGGDPIGVQGLSLGGYTTGVVAGLDDGLACVIAGVPAVDFADLMERHVSARFTRHAGYDDLASMARQVHRVVSPLAMPPLVPRDKRFIYAGLADRMVHPLRQVHELWAHWDRPDIRWFPGSHVGFFFSRPVAEFLEHALVTSGLVGRHEAEVEASASASLSAVDPSG